MTHRRKNAVMKEQVIPARKMMNVVMGTVVRFAVIVQRGNALTIVHTAITRNFVTDAIVSNVI